jgi:hypothetical protein
MNTSRVGEVGFAGAEKAGDPDADLVGRRGARCGVDIEKAGQRPLDGRGHHVLAQLCLDRRLGDVVDLGDGWDVAFDGVDEEVFQM